MGGEAWVRVQLPVPCAAVHARAHQHRPHQCRPADDSVHSGSVWRDEGSRCVVFPLVVFCRVPRSATIVAFETKELVTCTRELWLQLAGAAFFFFFSCDFPLLVVLLSNSSCPAYQLMVDCGDGPVMQAHPPVLFRFRTQLQLIHAMGSG